MDSRIYNRPPPGIIEPFISLGPDQVISDDASCVEGYEVFPQIDVWSRDVGHTETKTIAGTVRRILHDTDLVLGGGFRLVEIRHLNTRTLTDPDGLTSHGVMTFRAMIDYYPPPEAGGIGEALGVSSSIAAGVGSASGGSV